MDGLRRRVGRSASSPHGGLQDSHYEGASDGCSSADSASDLNEDIQDSGFGRRATGGERLGRIRAGMRVLSRTILGSRPTGSQDSKSSYSEDTSGSSDSDSSSYATDEDDSDSGDDNARHAPSLATTLGFCRRCPDASDFDEDDESVSGDDCAAPAPSIATILGVRRRRRPYASDLDFSSQEDQPHRRDCGAHDPYIPNPEDNPSRSRRCSTIYEEESTEGISSGLSENVRPGRDYGRYHGADVSPRQHRPR